MKHGFVKVALCVPKIKVGATKYNGEVIKQNIRSAMEAKSEIIVFGELSVTGATAGSMYRYNQLLDGAAKALTEIADFSSQYDALIIVGAPIKRDDSVYNCLAVIHKGKILALIPSDCESEFFDAYNNNEVCEKLIGDRLCPFASNIIIRNKNIGYALGLTIGEDYERLDSRATLCSGHGANVIVNPSSSAAMMGSYEKRIAKLNVQSEKINVGYIYVSSGQGESVSGKVMSGDKIVSELGETAAAAEGDKCEVLISEIDLDSVNASRQLSKTRYTDKWLTVDIDAPSLGGELTRAYTRLPFVPSDPQEFLKVTDIIGRGIYSRMNEIGTDKVLFGFSGGLDSTNVLLICAETFKKYKLPLKNINAVTMSGPASGQRTQSNAENLIKALGVTQINVPISEAVSAHLKDIGHNGKQDIVYENAQARERAQILLDLSNKTGALVLGTGDLSEIALGWSTYGGDQLAQYNPNSSLSKTLIKAMTRYYVLNTRNETAAKIVNDILATPISPELKNNQETEKVLGPYELHDFILYNLIGKGYNMKKLIYIAKFVFYDITVEEIKKHLKTFIQRFFINQFKRNFSCDGIQMSKFDLSNLKLNSDFRDEQWMAELDSITEL